MFENQTKLGARRYFMFCYGFISTNLLLSVYVKSLALNVDEIIVEKSFKYVRSAVGGKQHKPEQNLSSCVSCIFFFIMISKVTRPDF